MATNLPVSVTCSSGEKPNKQTATLTVSSISVVRTSDSTLAVTVGWEISGTAWAGYGELNEASVYSWNGRSNPTPTTHSESGTETLVVTDSDQTAHSNTLTALVGLQPAYQFTPVTDDADITYDVPAAELPVSVNVSGTIKAVQKIYANVGGTIKEITAAYVNVGGTIKQIF